MKRHGRVIGTFSVVCSGLLGPATPATAQSWDWMGEFDGRRDPSRVITTGDDILTVERVYVWDNGEGEHPDGTGSDWSW